MLVSEASLPLFTNTQKLAIISKYNQTKQVQSDVRTKETERLLACSIYSSDFMFLLWRSHQGKDFSRLRSRIQHLKILCRGFSPGTMVSFRLSQGMLPAG